MKILGILISLSLLLGFGRCAVQELSLEATVESYIQCIQRSTGLKAQWWSINATNDFFTENPHLVGYRVELPYLERSYQNAPKKVLNLERIQIFPDQEDFNYGPTPVTIAFQEINFLQTTISTDLKNNLKIGGSLEVSGQVSFISGSVSVEAEHSSDDSELEARSHGTMTSSVREYVLNPYSQAITKTILVKRKLEKYMTHDIAFYGYLAVAFSTYISPRNPGNYKAIKNIKQKEYWEKCGSGLLPVHSLKGIYFVPMGALADNVNFFKSDKNDKILYFHLKEVQTVNEEKVRSRTSAKIMVDNQKQAYEDMCK